MSVWSESYSGHTFSISDGSSENVMSLDPVIQLRDKIGPCARAKMPLFRMLWGGMLSRKVKPLVGGISDLVVWTKLPRIHDFYEAIGLVAVRLRHCTGVSVKVIESIRYGCRLVTTTAGSCGILAGMVSSYYTNVSDDCVRFQLRIDVVGNAGGFRTRTCRRPRLMDSANIRRHTWLIGRTLVDDRQRDVTMRGAYWVGPTAGLTSRFHGLSFGEGECATVWTWSQSRAGANKLANRHTALPRQTRARY